MNEFKNRVFGCVAVKAINSNYNADFSGQPRTLPSGKVYATDKALKYSIKNYLKHVYGDETIFYFKTLDEKLNPISLDEAYVKCFGDYPYQGKKVDKVLVAKNLLSCLDVRLFGATFAGKTNVSLHGPLQINHGVNVWHEDNIYTEQITSPFSNKDDSKQTSSLDDGKGDSNNEKSMTTIGRQSKLEEGHYVHHFSINPQNLKDVASLAGDDAQVLSLEDIGKAKEAMRRGVTFYDSASKAGCENEMLVWLQLKEGSKVVLPNFMGLVTLDSEKDGGRYVYDFMRLKDRIKNIVDEIENIEVYYNRQFVFVKNLPEGTKEMDL